MRVLHNALRLGGEHGATDKRYQCTSAPFDFGVKMQLATLCILGPLVRIGTPIPYEANTF